MKDEEQIRGVRDRRKTHWFWISNKTFKELITKYTKIHLTVYCYLAKKVSNNEQHTYFSLDTMTKELLISRSKACKALKDLERSKFIRVERPKETGYQVNNYWLLK